MLLFGPVPQFVGFQASYLVLFDDRTGSNKKVKMRMLILIKKSAFQLNELGKTIRRDMIEEQRERTS